MATQTSSEDVIFILDTSASMYRSDGDTNRLMHGILAIEQIIEKKIKIDKNDRYAVVLFGKKIHSMQDLVFTADEVKTFIQNKTEIDHETLLGEALSRAIQLILKQMRIIGQKLSRIIIISDGMAQMSKINPMNISKIAMQLGIIIDVIRLGPPQIPGNLLKKFTDMTHGDHYYVSNLSELNDAVDKVSKKKEKKHATIFDKKGESEDFMVQEMLSEIADIPLKLEEMTEEQKEQAIYNLEKGKKLTCTICYSDRCMLDKIGFYGCGRFCPNCLTPFHLHCALMWSESQSKKSGTISKIKQFRCTHCFYLLKIPISEVEIASGTGDVDENFMMRIVDHKATDLNNEICSTEDCGVLLSNTTEDIVYQCSACNSYFHAECLLRYFNKEKKCPYCKKIVSIEQ
jgi:hypothetical protein